MIILSRKTNFQQLRCKKFDINILLRNLEITMCRVTSSCIGRGKYEVSSNLLDYLLINSNFCTFGCHATHEKNGIWKTMFYLVTIQIYLDYFTIM